RPRDPPDPGTGAGERRGPPRPLADDRAAHTQGLDRPEGGRRSQGGGLLARPPGAAGRAAREPGPSRRARRLAASLSTRRAVRRQRATDPGAEGPGAERGAPHEREPPRQRRAGPQAASPAEFPRLRRRRQEGGADDRREHTASEPLHARRHPPEHYDVPRL